jgi:hypothetical protein
MDGPGGINGRQTRLWETACQKIKALLNRGVNQRQGSSTTSNHMGGTPTVRTKTTAIPRVEPGSGLGSGPGSRQRQKPTAIPDPKELA